MTFECICGCVCMCCVCTCVSEDRFQDSSHSFHSEFQGSNSGHWACMAYILLAEPSCQLFLFEKRVCVCVINVLCLQMCMSMCVWRPEVGIYCCNRAPDLSRLPDIDRTDGTTIQDVKPECMQHADSTT